MSIFDFLTGGKKNSANPSDFKIEIPPFFQDEYYKPTQDYLFGFGKDLLEGNPNDYFAPIGEVGGDMFEDVLAKVVRDTTSATETSAIRRGVGRGGPLSSSIAKNVGDISSKMRWDDFLRAMEGRAGFLTTGGNIVQNVRSAGLTNQGQRNNYQLGAAELELKNLAQGFNLAGQAGQPGTDFFGEILNAGAGLLADVFPGASGGGGGINVPAGGSNFLSPEDLVSQNRGSAEGKKTEFYKDPNFYLDIAKIAGMFALGGCWVAAAVFNGWGDIRTHRARYFINFLGPKWFKNFYLMHGEKIADFIKDKPILKALIRPLFSLFAYLGKPHVKTSDLKFKDQPSGKCLECRWNGSANPYVVLCSVPRAVLRDPVCILKTHTLLLISIDNQIYDDMNHGEEWKEGN